jgi:lipoate-protein ligase A
MLWEQSRNKERQKDKKESLFVRETGGGGVIDKKDLASSWWLLKLDNGQVLGDSVYYSMNFCIVF